MKSDNPSYPFIIGHRGAAGYAPENTMASLELAYELGVRFIEVDVMLTGDNHAIIFHDRTLDRVTSATGKVSSHSWPNLKQLDAGSWFHPDYSDQHILHLQDLIQFSNDRPELILNIEIKPRVINAITTTTKVVNMLKLGLSRPKQLILSSFDVVALKTAQTLWPTVYRALNMDNYLIGWPLITHNLKCQAIHINQAIASPAFVQKCHRMNLDVRCYTVNDPFRARQLKAMRVDGIFTDRPADLFEHIH